MHFKEKFKEKMKGDQDLNHKKKKRTDNSEEIKLRKEINTEIKESMSDMSPSLIAKYVFALYNIK